MDDRFNTIAGWVLASGIVALGLGSISSHYFRADKDKRPEKMGYEIPGVASASAGAVAVPIEALLAKADPAKGADVFKRCMSCHTIAQGGANGIGPNLYGVVGDNIAQGRGGFAFSDALKAHSGKWTFALLNQWLTDPRAFASGTKMTFAGLDDPQDRANVIVYLNSQGSNLPLPAAPAAGAAAPAAVAAAAPAGDATKGAAVFQRCAACHTINPGGANGIGPNLAHIFGDAIGKGRGGYAFSDALAKLGGKWDAASLDKWLTSPSSDVPGTKMTFAGIDNAADRADVIAYLKAN
ncbi:MAG: c-type cytochrome [Sphingomonadales bacterium]|nr:c-type cytochrome [Sphingomonadales bacterium]